MNELKIVKYVFILTFIVLMSAAYYTTSSDALERKESILKQEIYNLENSYKVTIDRFKIISDSINNTVINTKDIKDLLYKAKYAKDEKSLNVIRQKLYTKMKPHFDNLKKLGVNIILFSFKNNKTLLRVHKPEKYNDDLSKVRYSFSYANENEKAISGLEQGKISHAFRNINPIFLNGEFLASVDIAFSSDELQKSMKVLHQTDTHFIINKNLFDAKIWNMQSNSKYIYSLEHEDYLYAPGSLNKNIKFSSQQIEINVKYKKEIAQNITKNHFFALQNGGYIISFLAIDNIKDKKTVAYLVAYKESKYMKDVLSQYIGINILLAGVLFIIGLFVFISIKKHIVLVRFLSREIHGQNKSFEKIFEKASDGVFIYENSKIIKCNEAIVKMFNLKNKNDIIDTSGLKYAPEVQPDGSLSKEKFEMMVKSTIEDGTNYFEWKYKKSDGEEFLGGVTLTCIAISDTKTIIHALLKDITLEKKMQLERLREDKS